MSTSVPARPLPVWSAASPFVATGTACVVAGGLVAAAVATAPSELGSWAAAYLVLVGGVAQVVLGAGPALLAPRPPGRRTVAAELAAWNGGNAAVLAGTLLGAAWLADVGGAALVVALALALAGVRGAVRQPAWPLHLYQALIAPRSSQGRGLGRAWAANVTPHIPYNTCEAIRLIATSANLLN